MYKYVSTVDFNERINKKSIYIYTMEEARGNDE